MNFDYTLFTNVGRYSNFYHLSKINLGLKTRNSTVSPGSMLYSSQNKMNQRLISVHYAQQAFDWFSENPATTALWYE